MNAIAHNIVLRSGIFLAVVIAISLLIASKECNAESHKRSYISADAGYIVPFGLVGGVGWAPISIGEVYG
ncbi:MAG: hypothetical protein WBP29_09805, partial [Candidatus Zixiibacteriota bacterium]